MTNVTVIVLVIDFDQKLGQICLKTGETILK